MQVLVLLHEGKFYVSLEKESKELPPDYNPDDYWTEWEGTGESLKSVIDKLGDLFGPELKQDEETGRRGRG